MSYNPYRWFSKGKVHKPLPQSTPLLLKIRNGDFQVSQYYEEAERERKEYQRIYKKEYNSHTTSEHSAKHFHSHQKARMRNVARLKLEKEATKDENKILYNLRKELKREFGKDLWNEAHESQRGDGSIEALYWWYKEKCKIGITKSEMDIQLKRSNTKGLEYLFKQ